MTGEHPEQPPPPPPATPGEWLERNQIKVFLAMTLLVVVQTLLCHT